MKSTLSDKDTIFQTTIFDSKYRITERMIERVANGNSKIERYTLYKYDQQGNKYSSECNIIDSLVFRQDQDETEPIQWKVSFKDFNSPNVCELSKIRRLENQTEFQQTFKDKIKFEDLTSSSSYEYSMTSVYKMGKGLVSYKIVSPDGKVKDFILTSVK